MRSLRLSIILILFAFPLLAQQPAAPNIPKVKFIPYAPALHLPPGAGQHRDLKAKWESLPAAKRQEIWELFKKYVGPKVAEAAAQHATPPGLTRVPAGDIKKDKGPQVKATPSVVAGNAPLTVTFTATARDPSGTVTSYQWSFGDRTKQTAPAGLGSGASVAHTFDQPGTYLVSVLGTDDAGLSDVDHVVIRVNGAHGEPAPAAAGIAADSVVTPPPFKPGARLHAHATDFVDDDGDGLPDDFERQLADSFTPAYALSFYEYPWTGMSQMADVPYAEFPIATYPTYFFLGTTAVSYFRVTPLRVENGLSYLRIDYLEPWNEDDGLAINDACGSDIDILDFFSIFSPSILTGLYGHFLDNERAAFRVVAPAAGDFGDQFNLDPNAYVVDTVFTSAHEGTFFDHSMEFSFLIYPGEHLALFLTLSKHATYIFWPQGLPLMPDWLIAAIYGGVFATCDIIEWLGYDPSVCDLLFWIADEVVFDCITEKHVFQGFVLARDDLRTNVGELGRDLPGGSYIEVPEVRAQLLMPLF